MELEIPEICITYSYILLVPVFSETRKIYLEILHTILTNLKSLGEAYVHICDKYYDITKVNNVSMRHEIISINH